MDLIDYLLRDHKSLRESFDSLAGLLGEPSGSGWDDRIKLDRERFTREVRRFLAMFERHEAVEETLLLRVLRLPSVGPELADCVADGHHVLGQTVRLLGAVAAACDCEHVHGVRTVLRRLRDEFERHLSYEEENVFPRLREKVPLSLLAELGQRAGAIV